jgi:FkbM family methyltransferase
MIAGRQLKKVPRLLLAITSLTRKKSWGPFLEAWELTRFDHSFTVSWSQGGEDLALLHLLGNIDGRYIDVGAHHPSRFSVTRHLYARGWRGINLEANPAAISSFKKERPDDISLNFCVGTSEKYIFHIFDEPAISTSNDEWRDKFIQEKHVIKQSLEIDGVSLYTIINNYFSSRPDLLVIDTEGSDYDVLESCQWCDLSRSLWPLWIVCETTPPAEKAKTAKHVKLLLELGYNIYCILPMSTILKLDDSHIS